MPFDGAVIQTTQLVKRADVRLPKMPPETEAERQRRIEGDWKGGRHIKRGH